MTCRVRNAGTGGGAAGSGVGNWVTGMPGEGEDGSSQAPPKMRVAGGKSGWDRSGYTGLFLLPSPVFPGASQVGMGRIPAGEPLHPAPHVAPAALIAFRGALIG